MPEVSHSFIALAKTLELRWQSYRSSGDFDQFVEFTLSLNGLTERLGIIRRDITEVISVVYIFAIFQRHKIVECTEIMLI